MKKLLVATALLALPLVNLAHADGPTGEFGFVLLDANLTATSFTFLANPSTDSAPIVSIHTDDLANATLTIDTDTVTGLNDDGTATPENISDLLTLTTPTATYTLSLNSITATNAAGFYNFLAYGDLTGPSGSTPVTFTIGGNTPSFGSASLTALPTPEPGGWALALCGLGIFAFLSRRQSARA